MAGVSLDTFLSEQESINKNIGLCIESFNCCAKDKNLHNAFGKVDFYNAGIDKQKNLHLFMFDTYDFNKDNHTPLNQAGLNQMKKGTLKPSFSIHDIIVPNYVIDEIWQ